MPPSTSWPAGGSTAPPGDPHAPAHRRAPARAVHAIHRLVRACQLYDDGNESVQQAVTHACDAVRTGCAALSSDHLSVLFSGDTLFVNRKILRAPREAYALALQLGAFLERAGCNELRVDRDAAATAVLRFARLIVDAQRSPVAVGELQDDPPAGVALRRGSLPDEWAAEQAESPVAGVVKGYAAATLVLQSFYQRWARGDSGGARDVKRVAQKLVRLSEGHCELLVAAATTRPDSEEPVRRAVSTAVIALAMVRQLSTDRAALTDMALAALLADMGGARLAPGAPLPRLAPSAVVAMAGLGGFQDHALRRAVIVYEALRSPDARQEAQTRAPVLAVLLRTARTFNDLRSSRPGTVALGIDEAIQKLDALAGDAVEVAAVRLLVSGLGFFPQGPLVELTTGEVAMVTGAPAVALEFARPPVRILTDEANRARSTPLDVDLAKAPPGSPLRAIRRPVAGGAAAPNVR